VNGTEIIAMGVNLFFTMFTAASYSVILRPLQVAEESTFPSPDSSVAPLLQNDRAAISSKARQTRLLSFLHLVSASEAFRDEVPDGQMAQQLAFRFHESL